MLNQSQLSIDLQSIYLPLQQLEDNHPLQSSSLYTLYLWKCRQQTQSYRFPFWNLIWSTILKQIKFVVVVFDKFRQVFLRKSNASLLLQSYRENPVLCNFFKYLFKWQCQFIICLKHIIYDESKFCRLLLLQSSNYTGRETRKATHAYWPEF